MIISWDWPLPSSYATNFQWKIPILIKLLKTYSGTTHILNLMCMIPFLLFNGLLSVLPPLERLMFSLEGISLSLISLPKWNFFFQGKRVKVQQDNWRAILWSIKTYGSGQRASIRGKGFTLYVVNLGSIPCATYGPWALPWVTGA